MAQRKVAQQDNRTWYVLIALVFVIGLLLGLMGGVLIGRESVTAPIRDAFSGFTDTNAGGSAEINMTRSAIAIKNQDTLNQLATIDAQVTLTAQATP